MIIAKNITTDTTTSDYVWPGGKLYVYVTGVFDGATVQLNAGLDQLPKLALDNGAFTESSFIRMSLPQAGEVNFSVAGAGANTDVSIAVSQTLKEV